MDVFDDAFVVFIAFEDAAAIGLARVQKAVSAGVCVCVWPLNPWKNSDELYSEAELNRTYTTQKEPQIRCR